MNETFDEKAGLKVIIETIENAKNNIRDNGFFYLLWGWLVLIASLLHYFLQNYTGFRYFFIGWPVLMISGMIVSIVYGIRLGKRAMVRTYLDSMLIYLWWSFTFTLILLLFMTFYGFISFEVMNPLIVILFSMCTFVSGGIMRFRPLIIGGLMGWILGGAAFFVERDSQLLLTALAIVIAYLIPGYILKYRK
ncbi:MAG: hypothetical protein KKA81_01485 [Bacteroidetes bacterium]|nr:hypothetical protein [Bacteroidota bacterium]